MESTLLFYMRSSESDVDGKIVQRQLKVRSNALALSNFDTKAISPVVHLAANCQNFEESISP